MGQVEGGAAGEVLPSAAALYFLSLSMTIFLTSIFFLTANMLDLGKSVHPLEHVLKL